MTDQITYFSKFLAAANRTRNLQYGVLTRLSHNGKTYACMDDSTCFTEGQALEQAFLSERNELLGIFSIDMATGEIVQVMNRESVIDYCEKRDRVEMPDEAKREQAELDRHNTTSDTTL